MSDDIVSIAVMIPSVDSTVGIIDGKSVDGSCTRRSTDVMFADMQEASIRRLSVKLFRRLATVKVNMPNKEKCSSPSVSANMSTSACLSDL